MVCVGDVNEPKCNEKLCKTYSVQRDRRAVKKKAICQLVSGDGRNKWKKRADDSMEERGAGVPDSEFGRCEIKVQKRASCDVIALCHFSLKRNCGDDVCEQQHLKI